MIFANAKTWFARMTPRWRAGLIEASYRACGLVLAKQCICQGHKKSA
jgi:hypothetical protein